MTHLAAIGVWLFVSAILLAAFYINPRDEDDE